MLSHACYVAAYRRKLEEMAATGRVDLTLIVPPHWQAGGRKAIFESGNSQGYEIVHDNPVLNGHHHLHFYRHLGGHLRRLKPDVFHIDEEPYDLVTFCALRQARKVGAKSLFFTWQNLYRSYPPPFGYFEKYALSHCDGAIAGSQEAAAILRRKGYQGPLFEIPQFGVDLESVQPKMPGPTFRIGYVGRLVKEKGILILLKAVAGLEGNWEFHLLGDGRLRQQIVETARLASLSDRVRLVGGVPSAEVPSFLRQLDVLVLPSLSTFRWKEQFGRVLTEAMACGLPVVGSDSGEIPHVIGEAGLLFHEGDVEGLRSQLRRLMGDPGLRVRLGKLGRERVEAHYTHRRIAEKTLEAYDKIVSGAP